MTNRLLLHIDRMQWDCNRPRNFLFFSLYLHPVAFRAGIVLFTRIYDGRHLPSNHIWYISYYFFGPFRTIYTWDMTRVRRPILFHLYNGRIIFILTIAYNYFIIICQCIFFIYIYIYLDELHYQIQIVCWIWHCSYTFWP